MWLVRVTIPGKEVEAAVSYYWIDTPFRDEAIDSAKEYARARDIAVNAICCTEIGHLNGHKACNDGATVIGPMSVLGTKRTFAASQ